MSSAREFDVLVIGAGMYGIQSAKTYLEVHPNAKLAILEASESIGGTWRKGKYTLARSPISVNLLTQRLQTEYTTHCGHRIAILSQNSPTHHSSSNPKTYFAAFFGQATWLDILKNMRAPTNILAPHWKIESSSTLVSSRWKKHREFGMSSWKVVRKPILLGRSLMLPA